MRLRTLLEASEIDYTLVQGSGNEEIRGVAIDSRKVEPQCLFMGLPGTKVKGSQFVEDAVARGASAVLVSHDEADEVLGKVPDSVAVVTVPDIRQAAGFIAHAFFGKPSEKLKLVGITGTNGKTTCAFLIDSILRAWGKKTGISGTICQRLGEKECAASLTTPDCVEFHRFLKRAVDMGLEYVVTEVSSHALDQGRVEGARFETSLFTNLTRDHLDYHKDFESYFQAKSLLFSSHYSMCCAINLDDPYGKRLWEQTNIKKYSYGQGERGLDVHPLEARLDRNGIHATIRVGHEEISLKSSLLGRHNLQNILASAAVALTLGVPSQAIKQGIEALDSIPGRLEPVGTTDVTALVDYAHTPDAVRNVLLALSEIKGSGRIITVIGCGGDRDRGKRPEMAATACRYSDLAIFTSDNPRSEDPARIIDDMIQGVEQSLRARMRVIEDRKEAIFWACSQLRAGDLLLVAGKGHEDYQIIGQSRLSFDDSKVLARGLERRASTLLKEAGAAGKFTPVLRNVCRATGGKCHARYEFVSFDSVSTDSRQIEPGQLFWALKGERFDGNKFVDKALEKGASCAVCREFQ
ncbi:MAG: UDP-N-acetylmuramoyl-L-alanyl-D-glutamate--2,6-diaminopimelate ligase, partial [Thermodesulfobacteria bacterium]|nr:UDP-N-acetylmuramoyl-L-alanyl-D-glutamate--2,6-diaminopimelate ligase [Thermodesulfobacteriota bacterium]